MVDRVQKYLTRIWINMDKCKWYELLLISALILPLGIVHIESKMKD